MPLEIGLIGATGIAERTMLAPSLQRPDVTVRAVAASDPVRAKEYATKHAIPVVHQDYSSLLADPSIDNVHISLHNSAHHRWVVRAAVAGKTVIVEKPLCLTADELAEITFAAEDVEVFEAVATAGHEWQRTVREFIADERYGALESVATRTTFAVPAAGGYRDRRELGGGVFFDNASYWLQALQSTVGLDVVASSGSSDFDGPDGVDRSFSASLRWATGVQATLVCDVGPDHRSEHLFTFERATVKLRNFLRPVVGAVPLNLVITAEDRQVLSFPASSYYDRQLAAIADGTADGLTVAAPRIRLMAEIYQDARGN